LARIFPTLTQSEYNNCMEKLLYFHVDNGGYTFKAEEFGFSVEMGFYGYGEASMSFPELKPDHLEKLASFLCNLAKHQRNLHSIED